MFMRTRFAPSPTGSLHVGGLRTALYSFLLAKQTDGKFLLRIEDTDQTREVPGAVDIILKGLTWADIAPEEGVILENGQITQRGAHGPYKQSERLALYKQHVQKLLDDGNAYYAFDTTEELERMRSEEQARGNPAPSYNARIRARMKNSLTMPAEEVAAKLKAGDPYVIRMKVDPVRTITFEDDIRGHVSFDGKIVDDQVLMKSDGFPTYHLAHVVDDHLMEIDIVIRGEEWLPSLPKHLLLFEYFGWPAPRYAHVPLLLNKDKTKLSKRNNSVSVDEYIEKGYLPEALVNFIVMLGWNSGTTQDIFTMQELIAAFSIDRVQKAGAIFDTEKLDWLQGQWIRKLTTAEFVKRIKPLTEEKYPQAAKDKDFTKKAALIQERILFFKEAAEMLGFFYEQPTVTKELMANKKQKVTEEELPTFLAALKEVLDSIDEKDWHAEKILADVKAAVETKGFKLGQLLWPLRALLTGREYSPGAVEVAEILGKAETMKRLKAAQ
jgi:glutamyl-tRNA synthetase